MKSVMLILLSELMKNARKSDRELAKKLDVSQPTISRTRKKLEEEGYIREYAAIPNFSMLGYEILAFNFFKYSQMFDREKIERARKILSESFEEGPFEIIMAERGIGCGFNAVMISLHKDYTSLLALKNWAKQFTSLGLIEIESFLVNLKDEVHYKSLTLSTLARHVIEQGERKG